MKFYVKTPARLHLGLVDLNGDLGRIFGGLGVGISHPNVILEAQKSQIFTFSGENAELTRKLALQILQAYGIKEKVMIDVKQVIPEHVGLGSGTQVALAIAASLSRLFNLKGSIHELAVVMVEDSVWSGHRSIRTRWIGSGCRKKTRMIHPRRNTDYLPSTISR